MRDLTSCTGGLRRSHRHVKLTNRTSSPRSLLWVVAMAGMVAVSACLPAGESGGAEAANSEEPALALLEKEGVEKPPAILPAKNGVEVKEGLVFAGQVTEDELRALATANYRVLDLRGVDEPRGFEEEALAEMLELDYKNVPVVRGGLEDPAIHAAFREALLTDTEAEGPLVVHCASGNRVAGLYYAFLVEEEGVERAEALARAKELGLTSRGVQSAVDSYLDEKSDDDH